MSAGGPGGTGPSYFGRPAVEHPGHDHDHGHGHGQDCVDHTAHRQDSRIAAEWPNLSTA
ncbi:hypothetical protein ACGFT2_18535 [Streptomyces sp. NPDC048514]|uniref:hypothetical protein n=1 Tax=Streptomyces sp. NPDC048514 TaxID=3365564 RepID=UPI003712F960